MSAEQEMLDAYTLQIRNLQAELRAAQERATAWQAEAEHLETLRLAAQGRVRALREAVREYEKRLGIPAFASLAGSPSEKPGSESKDAEGAKP